MTSTSRSTSRSGGVDGGVGDGVLDDPVGERVAGAVERVALRAGARMSARSPATSSKAPIGLGEGVVERRQAPLAQLAQGGRELDVLAGQLRLAGSPRGT